MILQNSVGSQKQMSDTIFLECLVLVCLQWNLLPTLCLTQSFLHPEHFQSEPWKKRHPAKTNHIDATALLHCGMLGQQTTA
mmetsp:Transcript_117217/g.203591  ORF Transcript_117217/g.203591 Transcript_117217/m.203591 type:complete len:81 (+) Transcript_117217:66-308(+)